MKKLFIALMGFALLAVVSCKKEGVKFKVSDQVAGVYPTLLEDRGSNLDWAGVDTSTVRITIGSHGVPVDSVIIWVAQSASTDPSTWSFVKELPFSEGLQLDVSGAEMGTALGVDPHIFEADVSLYLELVTSDGRRFSVGNTSPVTAGQPAYNNIFVWTATLINFVCPWDRDFFSGNFTVQSDGWADYAAGDAIAVLPGPGPNQITLTLYPNPAFGSNRKNIVLDVDPATDLVTVAEQVYGDYPGFPNVSVVGTGVVSACSGIIDLTLDHVQGGAVAAEDVRVVLKK